MFRQSIFVGIDYLLKLSIGVILLLYLSRVTKPALFGEFLLIISAVNIYQTIGRSGFESFVLSEVNKFPAKTAEIISNTFLSSLLIFVLFAVPLSLLGEQFLTNISSSITIPLLVTLGVFYVHSVFDASLHAHAMRIEEKHRISDLCSVVLYQFKSGADYLNAYNRAYAKSELEQYVAPLYQATLNDNQAVKFREFSPSKFSFLGTPKEYEEYLRTQPLNTESLNS